MMSFAINQSIHQSMKTQQFLNLFHGARSCPGPTNGPRAPRRLKRNGPPRTGNVRWSSPKKTKNTMDTIFRSFSQFRNTFLVYRNKTMESNMVFVGKALIQFRHGDFLGSARTRPSRTWWWKLVRGCHLFERPFFAT